MKQVLLLIFSIITLLAIFSICEAQPQVVSVKDLGVVAQPATVTTRDGGFTTLAGGKVLWTFGDTIFNTRSADSTNYRSNTAALADPSNPLQATEPLDSKGTPFPALSFTKEEKAFNDSTKSPTNRIALWIAGLVPDRDGSALAFYSKFHVKGALDYDFLGVGTAHFRPDSTSGTRDPNLLFGENEPHFVIAFLHDGMVYLYGGITGGGLAQPYFVARAPLEQATQRPAYRFWNGAAWDNDVNHRAQIFGGVGSGLTLSYNSYLQSFTAVYSPVFSDKVVMRVAGRPEGPWSQPIELFTGMAPMAGSNNRQGMQHAELAMNNGQTIYVSYFRPIGFLRGEIRLVEVNWVLPPVAPTLAFPPDRGINQATTLMLQWNATPRAEKYRLQMSMNADFSTTVVDDSTIAITSRPVGPLANNTTYYWRVSAKNIGGTSSWSIVRSFTTIVAAPSAPILASPADSALNQPVTLTLGWNPSTDTETYRLQVSTNSDFITPIFDDSSVTTTSREVGPLANNTIYYWRVNAKNVGGTSASSSVWSFKTIIQLPSQVFLLSPSHAAVIQADSVHFSWRQGQPAVNLYWFELATDSAMTNPVIDSTLTAADTVKIVLKLINMQLYWWQVRAGNVAGWGPYSERRRFHIDRTSVEVAEEMPVEFSLRQNYPNPFNPSTTIEYALPQPSHVMLKVYDVLGNEVRTLVSDKQPAGHHRVELDAKDLPSGVYFYRIQAGEFAQTRKLTLLK